MGDVGLFGCGMKVVDFLLLVLCIRDRSLFVFVLNIRWFIMIFILVWMMMVLLRLVSWSPLFVTKKRVPVFVKVLGSLLLKMTVVL